jgi:hypothetical protein
MANPNLELLERAASRLRPLLDDLVFVGGCATGLLITDPAAQGIRPTMDVDVITEAASHAAYASLCERLRELGLTEDTEGGVICRWRSGELWLDVMPADERILGFSNRWYVPALSSARSVELTSGRIRLIAPEYFLATKLDAFHGRGEGDISASHDLEDAIAVIDGRAGIEREVRAAAPAVRGYLAGEFQRLLATRAFIDALPGFLLPDSASQARYPLLLDRLNSLASSDTQDA